jgi:AraC family transcriptional regulator
MPYLRHVRYHSPLLAWHDIELAEPAPGWSERYQADSPRLLVPATGWIEAEQAGTRFVRDALSPLELLPERPYRVRQPFAGQRSVALIFSPAALEPAGAGLRPRLGPAAHWRLARCRATLDGPAPDRLALEEALLGLWAAARGEADAQVKPHRAVERARELLASDPAAEHSLHDIAAAVACSAFHLARCFRRQTGVGLHRYRTRLRLALALNRLAGRAGAAGPCGSDGDLSALAFELGFSSHSHFSAAFRAAYGVPPSQVRRNLTAQPAR